MTLLEYIKRNYKNPNKKILRDLGASEKLIAYLFETPWNTNINVLKGMSGSSSDDGDTAQIPKVYVTHQGIDSENSDIKNDDDVIIFISNNYELSPKELTSVGYEATVKNGGTPIQFYVYSTPCIIDHIKISRTSPSTESINNVQLEFGSETDSDYGVRVHMWKPKNYIRYVGIYDDRE